MKDDIPITDDVLVKYVTNHIKTHKEEPIYKKSVKHRGKGEMDMDADIKNHKYLDPLPTNKSISFPGDSILGTNLGELCGKFNEKMHRHGIPHQIHDLENKNVSFYFAVLYCIKDNFEELTDEDKNRYVTLLIKKVINCAGSLLFDRFRYKVIGWNKKTLATDINSDEITTIVIRFVADLCHINIFVIDIEKDMLFYSGSNPCIIYKKNIILVRHQDSIFEPITAKKRYMHYKSEFIKFVVKKPHTVQLLPCNFATVTKKKKHDPDIITEPLFFEIGNGNEDFHVFVKEEIDDNQDFTDITIDNLAQVAYKKLLAFAESKNIPTTYFRNSERRKIRKEKLVLLLRNNLQAD